MATLTKSKWLIPGIAGVAGIGYLIYRKKKASEEQSKATEVNPYLAQSFIPVTAENVAGAGAVSQTGFNDEQNQTALIEAQEQNQQRIFELIEGRANRKSERESEKEANQFEWQKLLVESNRSLTGGGSQSGEPNNGTVVATTSPATPESPPNVPAPSNPTAPGNGCPAEFPLFNPAPGRGCYRISRTQTTGGCECHGYKSGLKECQQGKASNGSCHW